MSDRPTPETDAAWACFKGHTELLHDVQNLNRKLKRERDEAREENKKLKEALIRVRTWGVSSKNFSATDSYQMAEWIDNGCEGELPKPDGTWIYERLEESKFRLDKLTA
jgi:hypothetical protein